MIYLFDEEELTMSERRKLRENEIINYITNFRTETGYSPTIREIAKKTRLKSTSTVHKYLLRLEEKGIINWIDRNPRMIKVNIIK
ncbi:LexA repressor [Bacillus sp. B-jedd]|uniref:LexA family protein n=1 Tax=Bacillus sp. B-jedd TaxID=1476857 RepID=UPI00051560A8|nr:LexA repressor [Bacillus sp. B-jedd]CEG29780.1 LexA DNA-binding domain-containing protein [Bacillus sp. B-jedd]